MCISIIKEPRFGKLLLLPESVLSATLPPCFDPRLCNARTCIYSLSMPASPFPTGAAAAAPSAKTRFPRVGSASRPTAPVSLLRPLRSKRTSQRPASSCLCNHSARLGIRLLIPRAIQLVLEKLLFFTHFPC